MVRRTSISESGPLRPALVFAAALVAAVCPLRADWLVLTDGSRVETTGSWEVRGKMLVFYDADGNLASMRASSVDLDASEQLTEAMVRKARAAAQPKAEPKRESVLRLTDDDVSHVTTAGSGADEGDEDSDENSVPPEESLAVSSWDRDFDGATGSVIVRGSLRNGESVPMRSLSLFVILRNEAGVTVGRARARLDRPFLEPTDETSFVARFPGVSEFATVDFRADGTRPTPRPEATGSTSASPDE